jgi:hypothetical protein
MMLVAQIALVETLDSTPQMTAIADRKQMGAYRRRRSTEVEKMNGLPEEAVLAQNPSREARQVLSLQQR